MTDQVAVEEKENYEILLDLIEAGGATDDTLVAAIGAKSAKALPSQFKYIHVLKKWPIKGDDGVYYLATTKADYEKAKAKGKAPAKPKKLMESPQTRKNALLKSLQAKTIAMNKAGEKAKVDCNNDLTIWKNKQAICNFQVARLTYEDFKAKVCKELGISGEAFDNSENLDPIRNSVQADIDAQFAETEGSAA